DTDPRSLAALPDSPGATQVQTGTASSDQESSSQQSQQQAKPAADQEPAGAAAAQAGPTAGGAASRPAGMAIAPAKQHQSRSLLIKIGAIAGGAIALGT